MFYLACVLTGQYWEHLSCSLPWGGAIGPVLAGRVYDITGNCSRAFLRCSGFAIVALVLMFLRKPIEKQV